MYEQPGSENIPRYQEVINAILQDIEAGTYAEGDRLPTEHALCHRFKVSRQTVREALRRLQELGYLLRRQGSGSILTSRIASRQFHNSITSLNELTQYAISTKLEILAVDRVVIDDSHAEELGQPAGSQWIRISALRFHENMHHPIGYTDVYLDVSFEDVVKDVGRVKTAVYEMIEKSSGGVKINEVVQSISARSADRNIASRLAIEPGSPVLFLQRRYFSQDRRLVQIARTWHPAQDFVYEMTLRRN